MYPRQISNVTVVLDTNLTPELIEEGFVRELVSKIQTMRKEAGFEVTDHITVYAELTMRRSQSYLQEICRTRSRAMCWQISIILGSDGRIRKRVEHQRRDRHAGS